MNLTYYFQNQRLDLTFLFNIFDVYHEQEQSMDVKQPLALLNDLLLILPSALSIAGSQCTFLVSEVTSFFTVLCPCPIL